MKGWRRIAGRLALIAGISLILAATVAGFGQLPHQVLGGNLPVATTWVLSAVVLSVQCAALSFLFLTFVEVQLLARGNEKRCSACPRTPDPWYLWLLMSILRIAAGLFAASGLTLAAALAYRLWQCGWSSDLLFLVVVGGHEHAELAYSVDAALLTTVATLGAVLALLGRVWMLRSQVQV